MPLDSLEREAKEKKKRMIALSTLPFTAGFFMWRLQTNTKAAPPPAAPPPSLMSKAAPAVAAAAGPVITLNKSKVVVVVPKGVRDPFAPTMQLATPVDDKPKDGGKGKPVMIAEMPAMKPPALPSLPALEPANPPMQPFPGGKPETAAPVVPTEQAAPPPYPYVLTGVVKGDPDVAILHAVSDGSRLILRVGDYLDAHHRVAAINETTVVVAGSGLMKTLRVGGEIPPPAAKPAEKPAAPVPALDAAPLGA